MTTHLNKLLQILIKLNTDLTTDDNSEALFKLSSVDKTVLDCFNDSILTGEYYNSQGLSTLEEIKDKISSLSKNLNIEETKKHLSYVKGEFTKALNDFKKLIEYTKVKNNNKAFSVSEYDVYHLLNEKTSSFKYFKINVLLAKLDHDYHSSEEIERKLNRISVYLKNESESAHSKLYNILKDKVNFLLFKIKKRRDREYTEKGKNIYYNYFIEELENIDNNKYPTTKKDYHYYHKKSKYFRLNKKVKAINNLIIEFQLEKVNNRDDDDVFQKLAYQHMVIFLKTQKFRTLLTIYKDSLNVEVKINKIKQNFLEIKKEFDELVNSSKERYHYRFIKEYVLTIDKTFELLLDMFNTRQYVIEEEDIDFIRLLTKTLSKSRVIYAKYYKNFIKKKNIHLYLPFEECRHRVSVGKEPINLFIDSSYVLPLNYKEDKIVFNSLVKKIEDKISTIYFKTTELYTKTMEIKAENVVEKAQFNNIQVIAVFAGLITFITSSSVAFMSKDVKITSIAIILLTLIIAFTIFSLSLKILFESSKKEKYIFLVIILAILFSLHYFHYTNQI